MQTTNNKPTSHSINQPPSRRKLIHNIIIGLVGFAVCGGMIVVVILILFINALGKLKGFGDRFDSPICREYNPAGIQSAAQFKLPPSAKLLFSTCYGTQYGNQWEWAKAVFTMKPDELNMFLATTNVRPPLSATSRPEILICYCDAEGRITDYLYGGSKKPKWEEEVFIDTHDKNLYTVYLTVISG